MLQNVGILPTNSNFLPPQTTFSPIYIILATQ